MWLKVARPGASLQDVHNKTVDVIKAGLLKLGLITDTTGDQYKMWFTHSAGHYIGIDVHRGARIGAASFTVQDTSARRSPPAAYASGLQSAVCRFTAASASAIPVRRAR